MASTPIYSGQITEEQMNSGQTYRVQFSYGTFTSACKVTQSGRRYYYIYKRINGKLYKGYLGKCGTITRDKLHQATMKVASKIFCDIGFYPY